MFETVVNICDDHSLKHNHFHNYINNNIISHKRVNLINCDNGLSLNLNKINTSYYSSIFKSFEFLRRATSCQKLHLLSSTTSLPLCVCVIVNHFRPQSLSHLLLSSLLLSSLESLKQLLVTNINIIINIIAKIIISFHYQNIKTIELMPNYAEIFDGSLTLKVCVELL